MVLMMFTDGEWEKQMAAVEYADEKGATQQLQLDDKEFREVIISGHTIPDFFNV